MLLLCFSCLIIVQSCCKECRNKAVNIFKEHQNNGKEEGKEGRKEGQQGTEGKEEDHN